MKISAPYKNLHCPELHGVCFDIVSHGNTAIGSGHLLLQHRFSKSIVNFFCFLFQGPARGDDVRFIGSTAAATQQLHHNVEQHDLPDDFYQATTDDFYQATIDDFYQATTARPHPIQSCIFLQEQQRRRPVRFLAAQQQQHSNCVHHNVGQHDLPDDFYQATIDDFYQATTARSHSIQSCIFLHEQYLLQMLVIRPHMLTVTATSGLTQTITADFPSHTDACSSQPNYLVG
jgi:hypothetical protein